MDEYVEISQLDAIDEIKQNDWLLLSRTDHTTPEDIITSYKANAYEVQKSISSSVYQKLEPVWTAAYTSFKSEVTTNFSNHKTIVSNELSTLSCNLTSEWRELSTRMKNTCDTMDSLCVTVSTEISTFIVCAEISVDEALRWLSNDYMTLCANMLGMEARLKAWADEKFVTLSGNDTISGNKTFTKDINGCALSAKWI